MTITHGEEPRTYGPANPENSYFRDLAMSAFEPGGPAAERLLRHGKEALVESGRSTPEGLRSRDALRNATRKETRAGGITTASASDGAFVTPEYITEAWAKFRSPNRSFANQTTQLPLPEYGLQVNIPSFSSPTSVAAQGSELQGVNDNDPTGTNIQAALTTLVGQVTLSQQLHERGGADGLAFDIILGLQLLEQLNAAIDLYVLQQALANAGTITDASGLTIAKFYQDLALAREQLTDTAGVRMAPTHVFSTSDFFSYITRQVDSQSRPIVVPDSNALVASANDPNWEAWTGVHLPGGTQWHTDDNIPAAGANTQVIVARPSEVFTFDGQHVSYSFPEPGAQTLSVVVGLRAYVGVITRFPKAIAAISGGAYPTSLI